MINNNPFKHIKRSKIQLRLSQGASLPCLPLNRTSEDFRKAVVDQGFYVNFSQNKKNKK
jgi:hypothetical protein